MIAKLRRQCLPMPHPCGGGDSGGGGPSTTTTINKSEPPAFVQPWSEELMRRGAEMSNVPYEAFGGQKIAGMTPYQQLGLEATANRAIAGSPVMNAAGQNLTETARGDYLRPESNPYLAQMAQTVGNDVQNRFATMARGSGSGMSNSGWQEAAGRGMTEALGNLYGQNYQNERTNQMRAAMFAPQMAQADYNDAQALIGVGDAYRNYQQTLLNQALADWTEQKQWPYKQLDTLGSTIATASGGYANSSSSAPNPYQATPMASMIGGGMGGYALGNAMGAENPWMYAAGGGLLGGLW